MSVKKYKICDNQEYSRTPTPPSFASKFKLGKLETKNDDNILVLVI